MPKTFLTLFLVLLTLPLQAQFGNAPQYDPVEWSGSVEVLGDATYALILEGEIEEEWHIYSQYTPEGGPIPLRIEFVDTIQTFKRLGPLEESKTYREFSEIFEVDEVFFKDSVQLTQRVEVPDNSWVKMILNYQVCKEVCITQEFYFVFDLEEKQVKEIANYDVFLAYGEPEGNAEQIKSNEPSVISNEQVAENRGLWSIFIIAFLSGFAALLTPCVFPMIPMTVGFFTKQSGTKAKGIQKAVLYGLFIVVIYVLLGSLVVGIFGADSLNALATNVTFNLIFFVLLILFGLSFLGAFELVLPHTWSTAVDKQASRGGLLGIFFMALALAIVSFSCTGPIVGTLLVEAASKGGIAPVIGMLGFSLAIAIPFALFAMFPSALKKLPRSGGWMNSVKATLGFLEIALAFKFLSNADLVLQAHLLEREVFLAIWIAVFGALALYLLGKIKLPHDSSDDHISVGRLSLGFVVLAFTIYLIPGLWGAPLKIISGFAPPMNYSESPYGLGGSASGLNKEVLMGGLPEHAELGPHDILAFTDYDAGMAFARQQNKPALLDFTGYACINCRKMEERVWGEPEVLSLLKNEVVLISLYTDSKEELPENEQYTSPTTGKRVKTVGNLWSDFQIEQYQINAQPYYIVLDADGQPLNQPVGYLPDVDAYAAWLEAGIEAY
ncbi:protein-disulfide reductase DsbD family protein [Croceiramulus getboli]|nr:cytochrome c biogenesis protein CcdA [Flavobacteriaceae bacterium YJPT1-3]